MTKANEYNDTAPPRSRVKKGSANVFPLVLFIVVAVTIGFYFYIKNNPRSSYLDYGTAVEPPHMQSVVVESPPPVPSPSPQTDNSQQVVSTSDAKPLSSVSISDTADIRMSTDRNPLPGSHSPEGPASSDSSHVEGSNQYAPMVDTLNKFYEYLDNQPYIEQFGLQSSSREHFSQLIQKLLANPPVVAEETNNLYTLLKNTAHFFRILGKDNILLLKGILDRERDSLESMLESFYALTSKPQLLEQEYGVKLDAEALYDYASFLINTMGGRLYLFRRDSTSRMAVTFYAILVIDRANNEGNSRHGIDLRPALSSLIEEIENGGKLLQKREEYLDRLYDLQEKYN